MTPERYRQVEGLCRQALKRDANERDGFLRQACSGDDELLREVESCLAKENSANAPTELGNETEDSWIGRQLGGYRVVSLLGSGGMGAVYRAHDTRLKRDVAIKVLPEEFSGNDDRVSRFQREAVVLASLNHANIAAIYDVDQAGTSRYDFHNSYPTGVTSYMWRGAGGVKTVRHMSERWTANPCAYSRRYQKWNTRTVIYSSYKMVRCSRDALT